MENIVNWVEKNPWLAGLIGLGGVLIILWLLGYFSSSSSSSSSAGNSLAAAYYNAEAAQTTAGTQLQMATEYYNAQTAQDAIQAGGAEAIASTQANMYTTIGQQNAGTTTALGNDQLLAAENSSNDALQASQTAAMYGYQTAQAANQASLISNFFNNVVPAEAAYGGGLAETNIIPGMGLVGVAPSSGAVNPVILAGEGYSPSGVAAQLGVPLTSIA